MLRDSILNTPTHHLYVKGILEFQICGLMPKKYEWKEKLYSVASLTYSVIRINFKMDRIFTTVKETVRNSPAGAIHSARILES